MPLSSTVSEIPRPTENLRDPKTYPPSSALTDRCDLVMKGGITSGVIYPHAACQLAITRRLQRVGGTSAGAIAAGAAAAAELGRDSDTADSGFARLASLPDLLAETTKDGHTRLYHLFQPQRATIPLYRLVSVVIGRGGTLGKCIRGLVAGIRLLRPTPAVLCVAVPTALLVATIVQTASWGIVAAVMLLIVGLGIAVVWSLAIRLGRDLPRNHLGLCSGMRSPGGDQPALTEWLADEFDQIANRPTGAGPVTFGDLRANDVELAMFTTDLSAGTQVKLPVTSRIWAFDPAEFRQLFPERIVDWMITHPPAPRDAEDRKVYQSFESNGLHALPLADDLPIIVGVRMSLSFPVLLSTVPLHAFDYTVTQDGDEKHPLVRHRFSDGGITSNFPIHFFDSAVPNHPTFGINLIGTNKVDPDQQHNISMPDSNRDGILAGSQPVETFGAFVGALRNTLQNWADSMQTRVPGYRDRIVAVEHTKSEGGMNLDMDPQVVLDLAERGRYAGQRADHFDFSNHRWVRLRSFLEVLEDLVVPAGNALRPQDRSGVVPTYREMIEGVPPPSYRNPWNPAAGNVVADAIVALADAYQSVSTPGQPTRFEDGAPSPEPQFQIRPRP